MKLYIAILDEFPDHMVPTLVGHAVLRAHLTFGDDPTYQTWLKHHFSKVTLRVNQKEFDKICKIGTPCLTHENKTLEGRTSCVIPLPMPTEDLPNVLKFAKVWSPGPFKTPTK